MTTQTISIEEPSEFTLSEQYKTNRSGPVRWIFSHFFRYWYLGVGVLIGAFANAYLAAYVPTEIGRAFDSVLQNVQDLSPLISAAWAIVISQLVRGVLQFMRNYSAEVIGQLLERNIRQELYVSLLGKSMTFHNLQPVGDIMARATNDVREINFMFSPGFNLVFGSGLFMVMPLFVSPRYHPSLILAPAIFVVTYFLALWQYLHELDPITTAVRKAFSVLNTRLAEALDGIETVKGMAQEKSEVNLFKKNAARFRDAYVRQGDVEARFLPLLLQGLVTAGGLIHSLILFRQGLLSTGDVLAYFGLLQLFGFPTFASLFAYSQVSLGIASARRILEVINSETELDQNVAGYTVEMRGAIEFHNVSFFYDEDEDPVLKDISFKVDPGQTVAIVGQTGSGKTSLVKLINRTYDCSKGQVFLDGVNIKDWRLEALRRSISIIEQDIFLFSRSISENIAFGCPGADEEAITKASKAAQAHDFILEFEDAYDTVIGERGVTLSGGQRQRLALARAFLTNPKILVLDDSTSSIDSATEDKIQRAIYAAAQGRTTLIITHRLSQIRWADLIIVLRKGEIAAIGTHEDLLDSSEAYRRIFTE
jgi:ATP-binding cassette subfamily B protein